MFPVSAPLFPCLLLRWCVCPPVLVACFVVCFACVVPSDAMKAATRILVIMAGRKKTHERDSSNSEGAEDKQTNKANLHSRTNHTRLRHSDNERTTAHTKREQSKSVDANRHHGCCSVSDDGPRRHSPKPHRSAHRSECNRAFRVRSSGTGAAAWSLPGPSLACQRLPQLRVADLGQLP